MSPTFNEQEYGQMVDVLCGFEYSDVPTALNAIRALGREDDEIVCDGEPQTVEEFVANLSKDPYLAEDAGPFWFHGGPGGQTYYKLDLQCFLEDRILWSCCVNGVRIVADTLEEASVQH